MERCCWLPLNKLDYVHYHDTEWGIPVHDDRLLFEMLTLEGAQAGLSWYTILKRRDVYRNVFKNFNPENVSKMSDDELENILQNTNVIKNRLKVFSVRKNALVFIAIQQEFGSFDKYLWAFVNNTQLVNRPKSMKEVQTSSLISDTLSKDLKKRGMSFVGSTIIYAYMQAIGMVDDHTSNCFKAV
jgi:DNA-3-methyladenine glycosylase I